MKKLGLKNKGLTMIELMVALTIFILVLVIVISIFVMSVKAQRQSLVSQGLQDNARYLMETMAKEIRMSQIEGSTGNDQTISIKAFSELSPGGEDINYRFQNNVLQRQELSGGFQDISSSKIDVTGEFNVIDDVNLQPRVTIVMKVTPQGLATPVINLESTISARSY
jgi:type II secretory pathway pseudopilin PulG